MKLFIKSHGFSLIELMVVIAIVGVLAAVAVPSYKTYVLKTNINNAMPIIRAMANTAAIQYNNNSSFPSSLVWGGTTFANSATVAVNIGNVVNLRYDTTTVNGTNMIRIQANLSGLAGIPGYIAPTQTGVSTAGMIRYIMYDTGNGILNNICGEWFGDGQASEDLPKAYQPTGCMCNIANLWTNGTTTWTSC